MMKIELVTPRMLLLLWVLAALAEYSLSRVEMRRFSATALTFTVRMKHDRVQELEARQAVDAAFAVRLAANPGDTSTSHLYDLVKRGRAESPVVVTDELLQKARVAAAEGERTTAVPSIEDRRQTTRRLVWTYLDLVGELALLPIVMLLGTGYWWGARRATASKGVTK